MKITPIEVDYLLSDIVLVSTRLTCIYAIFARIATLHIGVVHLSRKLCDSYLVRRIRPENSLCNIECSVAVVPEGWLQWVGRQ